jgi:hypothetical protein
VDWQQPDINGAQIDGYTLRVLRNGVVVSTQPVDGGVLSENVDAENANDYSFTISATNKAGTSEESAQSASVRAFSRPDPVTSVTATAGDRSARIDFTQPSNGGEEIQDYEVQWPGGSARISAPGESVGGLANGNDYTFQVRACNTYCAEWGATSNSVRPFGPPPAPSVSAAPGGIQTVNFSWTPQGTNGRAIVAIEISIDGGGWQSRPATAGSASASGGYNANHSIRVRTVDETDQRSAEAGASANTPGATVTPEKGRPTTAGGQCSAAVTCYYIAVRVAGIRPGRYTFTPNSSAGPSGFGSATLTVDGNGNGYVETQNWFGYPGGWVEVTIDGVTGRTYW